MGDGRQHRQRIAGLERTGSGQRLVTQPPLPRQHPCNERRQTECRDRDRIRSACVNGLRQRRGPQDIGPDQRAAGEHEQTGYRDSRKARERRGNAEQRQKSERGCGFQRPERAGQMVQARRGQQRKCRRQSDR